MVEIDYCEPATTISLPGVVTIQRDEVVIVELLPD